MFRPSRHVQCTMIHLGGVSKLRVDAFSARVPWENHSHRAIESCLVGLLLRLAS